MAVLSSLRVARSRVFRRCLDGFLPISTPRRLLVLQSLSTSRLARPAKLLEYGYTSQMKQKRGIRRAIGQMPDY